MTRINLVPPTELDDKRLGAEYRELPRIYRLAYQAYQSNQDPEQLRKDHPEYVLGKGHVKFFYARLSWVNGRFAALVAECRRRGRVVSYTSPPPGYVFPMAWYVDWKPSEREIELNRKRLKERGNVIPTWP